MADRAFGLNRSPIQLATIDPLLPPIAKTFLIAKGKLNEFALSQKSVLNSPERERQMALRRAFWERYKNDLTFDQKSEFEGALTDDEKTALNIMPAAKSPAPSDKAGGTTPTIQVPAPELTRKLETFPEAWRNFLHDRKLSQKFIQQATDAHVKECDLPGYYLELRRSDASYRGAPLTLDDPSGDLNEALGWARTGSELKLAAQAGDLARVIELTKNGIVEPSSRNSANVFDYAACCQSAEKRKAVLDHLLTLRPTYDFEIIGSISALGDHDGDFFDECVYSIWRNRLDDTNYAWGPSFLVDIVGVGGGARHVTARYLVPLSHLILESMLEYPCNWSLHEVANRAGHYFNYVFLMFGGEVRKSLIILGEQSTSWGLAPGNATKFRATIRSEFSTFVSTKIGMNFQDLKLAF